VRHSRLQEMPGLVEKGLERARAQGAAAAKISFWQSERISASFENARLKFTGSSQAVEYSIDVIAAGRRGSTRGNDLADLDELVDRAVRLARVGSVAHFSAYPAPAPVTRVRTHSPRTLDLTRDRMVASCGEIVAALRAHDPGLYIEASASRDESEGLIATSGGVRHAWRNTGWSLGGNVQRTRGTDILFAGEGRYWRDLGEFHDPGFIAGKIVTDLRRSERQADPPPAGPTTVILSPELTGLFGWPLFMGTGGRNVVKGESPLKGRIGERIMDASVTIVDDPHRDFDGGAAEVDSDGIPTRRFEIVRDGVLQGFLYDLDSAGLAGAEPTGHNGCWPHSALVMPGKRSRNDLFASVSDGLYLKSLIGFGQSNTMNGDVSGNVMLGFRIRNGELVGRVKDTMVAGNVYELMKAGVELSAEVDPLSRLPYMKLGGLSVSSAPR